MKFRVGILLYDDVELLDFAGPAEVFASAKQKDESCFEVITIGIADFHVFVYGGIEVTTNLTIKAKPHLDLIIVPGGYGIEEVQRTTALSAWLNHYKAKGVRIASVCTGAFLLGELGFLNGIKATTHHEDLADFQKRFPQIEAVSDVRFVDEGQILTSAGISAGIDMALYLVEQFCGKDVAQNCSKRMEWDRRFS